MQALRQLMPGDSVEIIAPSSRCTEPHLLGIKELLESWGLEVLIPHDLFGDDVLCANTDEMRFQHLKNALYNPKTKAIICARGGYGSARLIPQLSQLPPSSETKFFVGMSDTTALQLFLQQQWGWPTIHGSLTIDKFSPESHDSVKTILFKQETSICFDQLEPLNQAAQQEKLIMSLLIGGNLTLTQASIGTSWQLQAKNHIILLEEVGERGYRIDRMLVHLKQSGLFDGAAAILLGDFTGGQEPDNTSLVDPVLNRFAQEMTVPVLRIAGVGHDYINHALPFGTKAHLQLGLESSLTFLLN